MGRGGARIGAGRPPLSVEEHRLRGTYRPCRHDRRPPVPEPLPYDWKPTAEELARLSAKGRTLIADALCTYEFNFLAGRVLLNAAETLDLIDACQASIDQHGVMLTGPRGSRRINPMVKEHLRHVRWQLRALKTLKLEHSVEPRRALR